MSSEVHKYIETALDKKENLFNAKVIDFPNEKKVTDPKNSMVSNNNIWKLYDKSNAKEDSDQLKAVTGICFMFGALIVMGLYSTLT
jgi:hypothetical protein